MKISNKILLSDNIQEISINSGMLKFNAKFKVISDKPFEGLVITKEAIENNINLEFKESEDNILQGFFTHNNEIQQNFVLLLKSKNQNYCDVLIEVEEIKNPLFKYLILFFIFVLLIWFVIEKIKK